MDAREEIKKRLSVEEVIGDYLQLKRSGRNFKALSPFTNEKTPSFMVSPSKQIWHDFSSGRGGDIFTFVMGMEGVDFPAAMEILARKSGVDLSLYGRGDAATAKKKQRLYEANALAARYYQQTLVKNTVALDYVIKKRRFNKAVVGDFQIGFAPSRGDALVRFMLKHAFLESELKDAGLATATSGTLRDMFRGRIMLPLADSQGRIIGFTGRILSDAQPKYLNTPQTILYDKSGHVYGLHLAKTAIRESGYAIIVEGNLDVVASHLAGVKQTVAIAGTAMTSRHLLQLSHLSEDVRLAFDDDEAGINATKKALTLAQSMDISVSVIPLAAGKDPDDIIRESKASWLRMVEHARYAPDWLIDRLSQQYDTRTVQGKKRFSDEIVNLIAKMSDGVEREHYVQLVAHRLSVSDSSILDKVDLLLNKNPRKRVGKAAETARQDRDEHGYQDLLLGLQLRYPEIRQSVAFISADQYQGEWRQATASFIAKAPHKPVLDTPRKLHKFDTSVKLALFKTEELYGSWSSNDQTIEAIGLTRRLSVDDEKGKKNLLIEALYGAESLGDSKIRTELLNKLQKLIKGDVDGQTKRSKKR